MKLNDVLHHAVDVRVVGLLAEVVVVAAVDEALAYLLSRLNGGLQ